VAFYGSGEDPRVPNDRTAWLLAPLTVVMVALLTVFFVLFHYTTVDGDSMRPTLLSEDRLLLTKEYSTPRRGDIVVFDFEERGKTIEVVKRVVGVPGDTVQTRGDRAWVNGRPEAVAHGAILAARDVPFGPAVVPKGTVFVLGDNRPISLDSRFIGFIPLKTVKGRAVAIFSPVTRLQLVRGGS
jgi:signal peptidase I